MRQDYTGSPYYIPNHQYGSYNLLVAVSCAVGQSRTPVYGLLDTASEWCVLPVNIATELGYSFGPTSDTSLLHTRFGLIHGRLERMDIRLPAEDGSDLTVDATCFISEDWTGPLVIGWRGFLERIHFALDTTEELFYFRAG